MAESHESELDRREGAGLTPPNRVLERCGVRLPRRLGPQGFEPDLVQCNSEKLYGWDVHSNTSEGLSRGQDSRTSRFLSRVNRTELRTSEVLRRQFPALDERGRCGSYWRIIFTLFFERHRPLWNISPTRSWRPHCVNPSFARATFATCVIRDPRCAVWFSAASSCSPGEDSTDCRTGR